MYGQNQCSDNTNGDCNGCADCRWSWPSDAGDKWLSAEAMCRCKPEDVVYEFGNSCEQNYNGLCGADCTNCHWSWPADDALKWDSADANCRCPASDIRETVFGTNCE